MKLTAPVGTKVLSGFPAPSFLSVLVGLSLVVSDAWGQQKIGVPARKLVVIDKLATSGKAKVVYLAEDPAITKGAAADPDNISAMFSITYAATSGTFFIQPGSFDGTSGWTSNDAAGASYVNEIAPDGPTRARKVTLKEASQLVLKARGVGDLALDIIGAGAPTAAVATLYCFSNGPDQMCHCSKFSECSYKIISDGAAAKLVCRNAAPDPLCNTAPSTTTTTSPVTTTTVFDQCGGSAFPVCGAPCSGDEVCSPFFAPASLGGNQCACVPPEPCGGTTPGVCPPGSACALLPPGPTFFCAPLECSGGADFPACGGSCAAGLECRALQVEAVGDGFCVCAPAAPCDSACGGYDCAPGDVCTRDLAGTCSCGAP